MTWFQSRRSIDLAHIGPVVELTGQFVLGEIDAATYDERYREFYRVTPLVHEGTFLMLDTLFVECDTYVDDPELREGPQDLDEDGLRAAAVRALARLALA